MSVWLLIGWGSILLWGGVDWSVSIEDSDFVFDFVLNLWLVSIQADISNLGMLANSDCFTILWFLTFMLFVLWLNILLFVFILLLWSFFDSWLSNHVSDSLLSCSVCHSS